MNTHRTGVLTLAGIAFMACGPRVQAQPENPAAFVQSASSSNAVKDVAVLTNDTLRSPDRAMEAVERVMAEETIPLNVLLMTAQAAFMLGAPEKAIVILERAVTDYPSDLMPGVRFPVAVVGNFWIGTFARHAGNINRAEAAYAAVVAQIEAGTDIMGASVLAAICYLYLSEIESHYRARPDKAAAWLKRLAALPPLKDESGNAVFGVYRRWGHFTMTSLAERGQDQTAEPSPVHSPYGDWTFVPALHSSLVGLGQTDDMQRYCLRSDIPYFRRALEQICRSQASPIDVSIAHILLANEFRRRNELTDAREHYGALFSSTSYFAPEGGMALARCLKDEGRLEEAQATLQEVVLRFPKYEAIAKHMLAAWLDEAKNE